MDSQIFAQSVVAQGATNLFLIILSSLAGAISILLLQSIHQKRILLSALREELIDNRDDLDFMAETTEENRERHLEPLYGSKLRDSAYKNLQNKNPAGYSKLAVHSPGLQLTYSSITYLEKLTEASQWEAIIDSLEINNPTIADGGEVMEEDHTTGGLVNTLEKTSDFCQLSLYEMIEYTDESWLRKVVYWKCLPMGDFDEDEMENLREEIFEEE